MIVAIALLALFSLPVAAHAHEVYVLAPNVIAQALATPSFNEIDIILAHFSEFVFWGFLTALVVFGVFFISISRKLERMFDPFLAKLPPYAPAISRISVGLSLVTGAVFGALFGPELPIAATYAPYTSMVTAALAITGVLITIGLYTRLAALVVLGIFCVNTAAYGEYMLTYTSYAGELLVLLVLGAHAVGMQHKHTDTRTASRALLALKKTLTPLAFPILRVAFGISLIYASLYAKILHNNLALAVTAAYPEMVAFFGFEPHFLILGAAIMEILLGIFFILGIEIRFASLFILFWVSLSIWYFGEAVWPHIILIGIPLAFICYGYDKYSLEGIFFKKQGREPVL